WWDGLGGALVVRYYRELRLRPPLQHPLAVDQLVARRELAVVGEEVDDIVRSFAAQVVPQAAAQDRVLTDELAESFLVHRAPIAAEPGRVALGGVDGAHLQERPQRVLLVRGAELVHVIEADPEAHIRVAEHILAAVVVNAASAIDALPVREQLDAATD